MFRDDEQRMLVIQTLLGVVGHADWVEEELQKQIAALDT